MRYPLDGPVNVQSPYGPRGSGFHAGIDLYAMVGTPTYALANGDVYYTANETAGGNVLWMHVDNPPLPQAAKVGYMHLSRFAVGPGTRVNEGDLVGWTGATGQITGPHLHLQFGTGSDTTDPLPHIGGTGTVTRFGKDLSKYQGADQVTPDFVILNVEDPYIGSKVDRAYADGIRWDIYKWCYPDVSSLQMFDTAKGIVDRLYRGGRYPQFWLDYEEGGVQPWQIDEWYHACDVGGVATGLYTYLYLVTGQRLQYTRDGWIAYYPNNGAAWQPSYSDTARAYGAKLHQFSSIPVDQNVVLDDAWYDGGATPQPKPEPPKRREQEMEIIVGPRQGVLGNVANLMQGDELLVEWTGNEIDVFGMKIPSKAVDFLRGTNVVLTYIGPGDDPNVNDLRGKVMTRLRWPDQNPPVVINS